MIAMIGRAEADEPPSPPKKAAPVRARERAAVAIAASPTATNLSLGALDPVLAKSDAESRLKILERVAETEMTAAQKALRELLAERLQWIDEWQKATNLRKSAENPVPTPEREAADRRAELERARKILDQAASTPEVLLPEPFRLKPSQVTEAKLGELREVVEAAKVAENDRAAEFERLRAQPAARATLMNVLRSERDKTHARTTTLVSRRADREAALSAANDENSRLLARDRLVNLNWEAAAEAERLHASEAALALETKRLAIADVAIQAQDLNLALAKATVKAVTERYRLFAESQKNDLHRAEIEEQARARSAEDPLERFLARRTSELLGLQAQILEDTKMLTANPTLSLVEQKALADRAEADFASLKQVVKENRVGGLVALRLNNDFRRISRERAMILRNELAQSGAANTHYENALTEAELAYFSDARDDKFERDAFVESLPPPRRPAASAAIDKLELKHKALLGEHRDVLDKLLARAEATHHQVNRRLRILDEQYAFVRTNIFWVRDSEPIGAPTLALARKDAGRLLASLVRLGAEPFDPSLWSAASLEFILAAIAATVLPLVVWRTRLVLKAMS